MEEDRREKTGLRKGRRKELRKKRYREGSKKRERVR